MIYQFAWHWWGNNDYSRKLQWIIYWNSVQQQMRSRNQCNKSCRLIYRFFDFIDKARSETFLSEYINFLILLIYLARKPFRESISSFWFYQYISLRNLFEQIYRFFDFINISRSETFSSEYIDFLILIIYLVRKPFLASVLIFRIECYILPKNILIKKCLNLDFQFIFLLKPQFFLLICNSWFFKFFMPLY